MKLLSGSKWKLAELNQTTRHLSDQLDLLEKRVTKVETRQDKTDSNVLTNNTLASFNREKIEEANRAANRALEQARRALRTCESFFLTPGSVESERSERHREPEHCEPEQCEPEPPPVEHDILETLDAFRKEVEASVESQLETQIEEHFKRMRATLMQVLDDRLEARLEHAMALIAAQRALAQEMEEDLQNIYAAVERRNVVASDTAARAGQCEGRAWNGHEPGSAVDEGIWESPALDPAAAFMAFRPAVVSRRPMVPATRWDAIDDNVSEPSGLTSEASCSVSASRLPLQPSQSCSAENGEAPPDWLDSLAGREFSFTQPLVPKLPDMERNWGPCELPISEPRLPHGELLAAGSSATPRKRKDKVVSV